MPSRRRPYINSGQTRARVIVEGGTIVRDSQTARLEAGTITSFEGHGESPYIIQPGTSPS